jgi:ribosomal protein S18 acetylase RimI-like enzyme
MVLLLTIVRCCDHAAGRIMVNRSQHEILLVDVALLPEYRNRGIGSSLISGLMKEASRDGKSIRLHVDRFNFALRWYQRLGFQALGESEVYVEMIWRPDSDADSLARRI